jgi:hypothetical protein
MLFAVQNKIKNCIVARARPTAFLLVHQKIYMRLLTVNTAAGCAFRMPYRLVMCLLPMRAVSMHFFNSWLVMAVNFQTIDFKQIFREVAFFSECKCTFFTIGLPAVFQSRSSGERKVITECNQKLPATLCSVNQFP